MPAGTASAVVPASLPHSLLSTPFSVQMALRRLGEEPGQRTSTMICFCTASGCRENLPVGAAVEGVKELEALGLEEGGARWAHQASVTVRTHS